MGLDICVRRICKKEEAEDEYDYFQLVDNDGNYQNDFPSWTKEFEDTITEDWYDWDKYKEETGIDVHNCDWQGQSYTEKGSFMELSIKGAKVPVWDKEKWKDYDEFKKECDKVVFTIDLEKVPTYKKEIKVLYYNEVGYQRKGLNDLFYDDYEAGKIGYFVWSKAELERYKRDYCDEPYEYQYPNGEMSGDMIYPKDDFQSNIIDSFEEGKDCVIFDW